MEIGGKISEIQSEIYFHMCSKKVCGDLFLLKICRGIKDTVEDDFIEFKVLRIKNSWRKLKTEKIMSQFMSHSDFRCALKRSVVIYFY